MKQLVTLAAVALIATACSVGLQAPSASPTASPAGETSPSPSLPLGSGSPNATDEAGGLRIDLWVDPMTVALGDRVMAKVRVTNVGTDAPMWESNTCGNGPAPLQALSRGGFEPGSQWDGHAAKFKTELMHAVGLEQRGASVVGRFIAAESKKWSTVVKTSGAKVD